MAKMLILNVGHSNKGNCALVKSTMDTINLFFPNSQFWFMGPERINKSDFSVVRQISIISANPRYIAESAVAVLNCVLINSLKRMGITMRPPESSPLYHYHTCDMIINSGGDSMSGEYGIGTLSSFLNLYYAILLKKPIVLYGDSLGYYKSGKINYIAKHILNRVNLIILREDLSRKYLEKNEINFPRILVTADPAFILDVADSNIVREILLKEGIGEIQRPLIGINPNGLLNRLSNRNENTSKIIAKIADYLIENINATILLVPHVYTPGVDDRITIQDIMRNVINRSRVRVIHGEYSPQELKGVIGLCDLFIAARMHAAIAATSMLVPTIGIAYSHKMHGIIGEMLGQKKYILNVEDLNYESLKTLINDAWDNRFEIKKKLSETIPMVREKALLNGRLVKELAESLNIVK